MKRLGLSSILLLLAACGGEDARTGLGEPVVIHARNVSFKAGALPGLAPGTAARPDLPVVTFVDAASTIFFPGLGDRTLAGRASTNAVAVALRFEDRGSGYWVLPVGVPDLNANNELSWDFGIDIDGSVPPGNHRLLFAALNDAGQAGVQQSFTICVASPLPDNLNACEPSIPPPAAILSLSWDTGADLDLEIVTPLGAEVDSRSPSIGAAIDTGAIDRDAQQGCHQEGARRENLVWQNPPAPGPYQVYVNMFDACHQAIARFTVKLFRAQAQPDGSQRLVETWVRQGNLLPVSANGGAARGLFVGVVDL